MKGRVFKVSSIAGGGVSVVFHVDPSDADVGMGLLHLRGRTVQMTLTKP